MAAAANHELDEAAATTKIIFTGLFFHPLSRVNVSSAITAAASPAAP